MSVGEDDTDVKHETPCKNNVLSLRNQAFCSGSSAARFMFSTLSKRSVVHVQKFTPLTVPDLWNSITTVAAGTQNTDRIVSTNV